MKDLGLRPWMTVFRVLVDFCREGFENVKSEFEEVEGLVEKEEHWIDLVKFPFLPLLIQWSLDVNEKTKIVLLQLPKSDTLSDQPHSSLAREVLGGYGVRLHFSRSSGFFGIEFQNFDDSLWIPCIVLFCNSRSIQKFCPFIR